MNDLRIWIGILTLTAFAAGLGVGVFAVERTRAEPAGASEAYEQLFLGTFALEAERRELLGQLLSRYEEEVEARRQAALAASLDQLEEPLARIGLRYREAIRNHVLRPAERARFDELVAASAPPPQRP